MPRAKPSRGTAGIHRQHGWQAWGKVRRQGLEQGLEGAPCSWSAVRAPGVNAAVPRPRPTCVTSCGAETPALSSPALLGWSVSQQVPTRAWGCPRSRWLDPANLRARASNLEDVETHAVGRDSELHPRQQRPDSLAAVAGSCRAAEAPTAPYVRCAAAHRCSAHAPHVGRPAAQSSSNARHQRAGKHRFRERVWVGPTWQ